MAKSKFRFAIVFVGAPYGIGEYRLESKHQTYPAACRALAKTYQYGADWRMRQQDDDGQWTIPAIPD